MKSIKVLHVIFGDSASGALKTALKNEALSNSHSVLPFLDDLSVGQLPREINEATLQQRGNYFAHLPDSGNRDVSDMTTFFNHSFEDYQDIVLWHVTSTRDKLLAYLMCWWLTQSAYPGKLYEVALEPQMSRKQYFEIERFGFGLANPPQLATYLAEKTPLSAQKQTEYAEQWDVWRHSISLLRIFKADNVMAVDESYFDEVILSIATDEFQKSVEIISKTMMHIPYPIGDCFLASRVRTLVKNGLLISDNEDIASMRAYSVKLS